MFRDSIASAPQRGTDWRQCGAGSCLEVVCVDTPQCRSRDLVEQEILAEPNLRRELSGSSRAGGCRC